LKLKYDQCFPKLSQRVSTGQRRSKALCLTHLDFRGP